MKNTISSLLHGTRILITQCWISISFRIYFPFEYLRIWQATLQTNNSLHDRWNALSTNTLSSISTIINNFTPYLKHWRRKEELHSLLFRGQAQPPSKPTCSAVMIYATQKHKYMRCEEFGPSYLSPHLLRRLAGLMAMIC